MKNNSVILTLIFVLVSLTTNAQVDDQTKSKMFCSALDNFSTAPNYVVVTKTFTGDRKEQVMFAHLMFNNGVMMTRGCIAGNICGLTYFKSK